MPLIIAIETATKLCSVAVARDGVVLAARDLENDKHIHAEKVNVFIAEVMAEAGVTLSDLHAVAVGIGPGSYTGLRIGLSAAKGLCFALDIPIIGLSTLGTLVAAAKRGPHEAVATLWPMIDARRMEVFAQRYDVEGRALDPAAPLLLDAAWAHDAGHAIVLGDGAEKAAEIWNAAPNITLLKGIRPHASAMTAEALRRFSEKRFDDLAYLVPEYGKAANVAQPKKQRDQ